MFIVVIIGGAGGGYAFFRYMKKKKGMGQSDLILWSTHFNDCDICIIMCM